MPDPQIVSYSLQQLIDNPDALASYFDPRDYLKESGPRWVEFLASNSRGAPGDLAIVLTVVGHRIVGSLRSIPVELRINGTTIRSVALRAFFLDPEWRGGGAGGMMLLRVLSTSRSAIASGGPRPETVALYIRAGFKNLGPLSRYVYFNSTAPLVTIASRDIPFVSNISAALDPCARLYYRARSPAVGSNLTFTAVDGFSDDLNHVLGTRTDDHMVRESQDLNWILKYSRSLCAYEIRDRGVLAGYSLIRTEDRDSTTVPLWLPAMRVASLLDFYIADPRPGNLHQLVSHVVARSKADRAEILEIQTTQRDLVSCLRRLGFIHLGGHKVLLRPPAGVEVDPDRWQMTEAQGDVMFSALSVSGQGASERRVIE